MDAILDKDGKKPSDWLAILGEGDEDEDKSDGCEGDDKNPSPKEEKKEDGGQTKEQNMAESSGRADFSRPERDNETEEKAEPVARVQHKSENNHTTPAEAKVVARSGADIQIDKASHREAKQDEQSPQKLEEKTRNKKKKRTRVCTIS